MKRFCLGVLFGSVASSALAGHVYLGGTQTNASGDYLKGSSTGFFLGSDDWEEKAGKYGFRDSWGVELFSFDMKNEKKESIYKFESKTSGSVLKIHGAVNYEIATPHLIGLDFGLSAVTLKGTGNDDKTVQQSLAVFSISPQYTWFINDQFSLKLKYDYFLSDTEKAGGKSYQLQMNAVVLAVGMYIPRFGEK